MVLVPHQMSGCTGGPQVRVPSFLACSIFYFSNFVIRFISYLFCLFVLCSIVFSLIFLLSSSRSLPCSNPTSCSFFTRSHSPSRQIFFVECDVCIEVLLGGRVVACLRLVLGIGIVPMLPVQRANLARVVHLFPVVIRPTWPCVASVIIVVFLVVLGRVLWCCVTLLCYMCRLVFSEHCHCRDVFLRLLRCRYSVAIVNRRCYVRYC